MISEDKIKPVNSTTYTFDEFRFETGNLLLQKNSEVVPLAPKTLEVLLTLVESGGKLITKQEILDKVWKDTFVEEANLTHHISALRKALGEDKNGGKFIETISRRGYRFTAPVCENKSNAAEIIISERVSLRLTEETEIEACAESPQQHSATAPNNWLARHKIAVAAGILPIICAGLFFYFAGWKFAPNSAADATRLMLYTRVNDDKDAAGTIISPDGKFAAYLQNYNEAGGGTLYIRQLETNREMRLLEPDERTFGDINFSPDGAQIYYISFEKNAKIGVLFSVSILGGKPKRLLEIDDSVSHFTLSPDGKNAAFFRIAPETKTVSLDVAPLDGLSGGEQTIISRPESEPFFGASLAWSPDNRVIAFGQIQSSGSPSKLKLAQIDLQTGAVGLLADEQFRDIGKMCFSADGSKLYFVAEKEIHTQKIYALNVSSRQIRLVTKDANYYGNYGMAITADDTTLAADLFESKADLWNIAANGGLKDAVRVKRGETNGRNGIAELDGGTIAYVARVGDRTDIWTIQPDGSNAQPLTNDAFREKDLTASPDKRFIVFTSDRAAENDRDDRHIYRMNADGSDVRQLTFGETKDVQPDFSPDGKWLVYVSLTGENSVVKKVSVEGGAPVTLTDYLGVYPKFSPDGSRIALRLLSDSRSLPGKIVVIPATGGKPEKTFPVTQFEWIDSVTPIRWTPDGTKIVFRKEVNGIGDLWQQNLDGSPPQQITHFTSDTIYNFIYSGDGQRIIISRGVRQNNAVLIRNFESF